MGCGDRAQNPQLTGHESLVNSVAFAPDGPHRTIGKAWTRTFKLWDLTSGQALVDRAKTRLPRCLTPEQRRQHFLIPKPPRWCITGAGLEAEAEPGKWQPKWPYNTPVWRDWLAARDRGETPPLPADNGQ